MQLFTKFAGLDGALVLVTGGATGIGSAIVENFVRQGSRVVFLRYERGGRRGAYRSIETRHEAQPGICSC
jgi:NAD(P)-dependent dehydrogenase (short-subunit alcohol dehydrogenase family)